jgi:hypothetical protein
MPLHTGHEVTDAPRGQAPRVCDPTSPSARPYNRSEAKKPADKAAYAGELLDAVASDLADLERAAHVLRDRIQTPSDVEPEHAVACVSGLAEGLADGLHQLAARVRQQAAEVRKPERLPSDLPGAVA